MAFDPKRAGQLIGGQYNPPTAVASQPSAPTPTSTAPQSPWANSLGQMTQGMSTGMPTGTGATMAGMIGPAKWNAMPQGGQTAVNNAAVNTLTQRAQAPGEGYGPGFGETYGKEHIGQYDQPTMLEQFAQQQMNGNNPYYDRLRSQGMASINQQMAARGHYNSGGALSALGNYSGALDAAQFKDMGDLVGNASGLGFQRQQAGMNQAANIQGLQQGRIGQQFSQLSDIAHLGSGTIGGFYGQGGQQSGDAAMSAINAGANASQLQGQGQSALPNMLMQGANIWASGRPSK